MRYPIAALTVLSLACTSATDSVGPRPSAPPAPVTPPAPTTPAVTTFTVSGSAAWTLALNKFSVLLFRRAGSAVLQYEPEHLELAEIGGKSAATLVSIVIDAPGGTRDGDCTDSQKIQGQKIAALGTRDLAVTMSYCVPYVTTKTEVSEVTLTAEFLDDQGQLGKVEGKVSFTGCTLGGASGMVSCK